MTETVLSVPALAEHEFTRTEPAARGVVGKRPVSPSLLGTPPDDAACGIEDRFRVRAPLGRKECRDRGEVGQAHQLRDPAHAGDDQAERGQGEPEIAVRLA